MRGALIAFSVLAVAGCTGGGVSDSDQRDVKAEFSQENYERAMKSAGKEEALEREKQMAREHLQGGG